MNARWRLSALACAVSERAEEQLGRNRQPDCVGFSAMHSPDAFDVVPIRSDRESDSIVQIVWQKEQRWKTTFVIIDGG